MSILSEIFNTLWITVARRFRLDIVSTFPNITQYLLDLKNSVAKGGSGHNVHIFV